MRHIAGFALSLAAALLATVALLIGSPALFYITTAMIATIGGCHFQAWLSVRGLRVERVAPETARVGDLITVEVTVWSLRRIRRPLITITDNLPKKLRFSYRGPSLPIAPAFDLPIRTQYQFRPLRRGVYRWSGVTLEGTDALGLVTKQLVYPTSTAEMTVLPQPIPVAVELPPAAGWGLSEATSGQNRGAGIEPRGIRQYTFGDELRHVHWRSTARTGQLLVKEFEAGSQAAVAFVLQATEGTDLGKGSATSLDLMCGHVAYLADQFLRQGVRIDLPGLDSMPSHHSIQARKGEILQALATIQADHSGTLGDSVASIAGTLPPGSVLFVLVIVADPSLPHAISVVEGKGTRVVPLVYDALKFFKGPKAPRINPAVTDEYLRELRAVGSSPVVMPSTFDEDESLESTEVRR